MKTQPIRRNFKLLIAFRRLEKRLRRATAKSKSSSSRTAAIAGLEAFLEFISLVPQLDRQHLATPIWPLLVALKDLEKGRVAPMFRPRAGIRHRSEESWMRKLIKAHAVLSIEILRSAGANLESAPRFVARELESTPFPIGGRLETPAWKTVKGWRERISKLPARDEGRRHIHELRKQVPWQRLTSIAKAKPYVSKKLTILIRKLGQAALE